MSASTMAGIGMVVVEAGLIFGGTLGFCLWQLRSLKRDRAALERRKAEAVAAAEALPPG